VIGIERGARLADVAPDGGVARRMSGADVAAFAAQGVAPGAGKGVNDQAR
jgi:hypothetical protein